jgi:hypothetical protein
MINANDQVCRRPNAGSIALISTMGDPDSANINTTRGSRQKLLHPA